MSRSRALRARALLVLAVIAAAAWAAPVTGVSASSRPSLHDVAYCAADGHGQRLDVLYPTSAGAGLLPAVLWVHGGSWMAGDKSQASGSTVTTLRARGFVVIPVNYRLAPRNRFPAQIEDLKCAVRFVRAHAATLGIDASRIGAFGLSAGGHLAALLGVAGREAGWDVGEYAGVSSRVRAVVDLFGVHDLSLRDLAPYDDRLIPRIFGTAAAGLRRASPVNWVSADDPPFLLMHGAADSDVPIHQSQLMDARLRAAGVASRLVVVAHGEHGFAASGGPINPGWPAINATIAGFLERNLGSAATTSAKPTAATRVVIGRLNMRVGPGIQNRRVTVLQPGTRLAVLGSGRDAAGKVWYHVRLADGRTGWVASWYTRAV